jgi:hypothetical protein
VRNQREQVAADATSQKTAFLIVTAVKTSCLTSVVCVSEYEYESKCGNIDLGTRLKMRVVFLNLTYAFIIWGLAKGAALLLPPTDET